MGIKEIVFQGKRVVLHGNFEKPRRYKNGRPKNWAFRDYKALVAYPFKWRSTLGKVQCNCEEVIEAYQPYYGTSWYHEDACAIMVHFRKYPQMENFGIDPSLIAMTD